MPAAVRFLALLLGAHLATAAAATRIVAVGDVHGDLQALVSILRELGLIDGENRWSGADATLVQTGDLLDRGHEVREVMDLMMALQAEAPERGGRVVVLLGNHEAWNLLGDLQDASPKAFASFMEDDSDDRRLEAAREHRRWANRQRENLSSVKDEESWLEAHPPGFVEYLEAIGPGRRYGRWLRSLPAVAKVGDTVFVHGGISGEAASLSIRQINQRIREEILKLDACRSDMIRKRLITPTSNSDEMVVVAAAEMDRLRRQLAARPPADGRRGKAADAADTRRYQELYECVVDYNSWFLVAEDSPLSFRGFALWSEEAGRAAITKSLKAWQAERFVVGHTTMAGGQIRHRFDGRVVIIDTGMSPAAYEGGRPAALEIEDGVVTAVYLGGRTTLRGVPQADRPDRPADPAQGSSGSPLAAAAERPWLGVDGRPLPFRSEDELEEFLRTARVVSAEPIPKGINSPLKLLLEHGGHRAHAIFRSVSRRVPAESRPDRKGRKSARDHFAFECAAYELDRLLGIGRVPPAVPRQYKGSAGSVQIWVENAFDEATRRRQKLEPPDPDTWAHQRIVQWVFDALINNFDRNQENQLVDRQWRVWLIDHTRSFAATGELKECARLQLCDRALWEKLQTTDRELVERHLSPYLSAAELRALFARWDQLVDHFRSLIEQRGKAAVVVE